MKEADQHLETVAALVRAQNCLSLATTGPDGEACIAPLFYIVDEQLSVYWVSSESSLHSLNLERTPRAAAAVYRDTTSWKQIQGVQLRGVVRKIVNPAQRRALIKAYSSRFNLGLVFRVALRRSAVYALEPDFFRYVDNSKGFGYKFELSREPAGWVCTRPAP